MTKDEEAKLKAKLKKELIEEMKDSKDSNYNFDKYKEDVVADDIKKVEKFAKENHWYWYIPIIGFFIYSYAQNQMMVSIDRGAVRKSINNASLKWCVPMFLLSFTCLMFVINLVPPLYKGIYKTSLKNVDKFR